MPQRSGAAALLLAAMDALPRIARLAIRMAHAVDDAADRVTSSYMTNTVRIGQLSDIHVGTSGLTFADIFRKS